MFDRALKHLRAAWTPIRIRRAGLIVLALGGSHVLGVQAEALVVILAYLWSPAPALLPPVDPSVTPKDKVGTITNDDEGRELLAKLRDAEGIERERLRLQLKAFVRRELDRIWSVGDRGLGHPEKDD